MMRWETKLGSEASCVCALLTHLKRHKNGVRNDGHLTPQTNRRVVMQWKRHQSVSTLANSHD